MTGLTSWLRVQWDRAGAVGAALVGLAALVIGWVGVSGTPHIAEQLPYFISGGLVAMFFLGMAVTLWLSADLRDEWRELRALRLVLAEPSVAETNETNLTDAPLASVAAGNGNGR